MKRLLFALAMLCTAALSHAAPAGVYRADVAAPLAQVYPAVQQALEGAGFFAVFEVDLGAGMARFADRWGEDYNRSGLSGVRTLVICNARYANAVANADPDLLALCPLRVGLVEKDGATRVLFARPSVIAAGSPGEPLVKEIEGHIIEAIGKGIAQVQAK